MHETRALLGLGSLLALSACSTVETPSCPEDPLETASVSSTSLAHPSPGPGRARLEDCIGDADRARAQEVDAARAGQLPFAPSGVWLPPVYVADAKHSVEWIGLLYLQLTDFEAGSRTRVLPPLLVSLADQEKRTLLTPLFGARTDAEGTFGYAANYLWRRDRLADTDVLFPFYWSFRERDLEGGPDARSSGALAPFAFWHRDTSGVHRTFAPPLFWRWGDALESTTLAGPVYSFSEPGSDRFGAFPFYFGGRDANGAFDLLVPFPLYRSVERTPEGETTSLFALNTYAKFTPSAWTWATFPLVFAGQEEGSHFACVPPALFFHQGDGTTERTLAANVFYASRPDGWSFAFAPLVFAGRSGEEGHQVVAPLYWHFRGEKTDTWVAGPAFHRETPDSSTSGVLPFWVGTEKGEKRTDVIPPLLGLARRDGKQHSLVLPAALTYHDGDGETERTLVANTWLRLSPGGWSFAFAPLVFAAREGEEHHELVFPLLWRWGDEHETRTVAPLFYRSSDEKESTTVAGTFYLHSEEDSWHAGLAPLWFSGRRADGSGYDVGVPLLWRFRGAEGERFALVPLFDWAEDSTRKRLVSPVAYHHEDLVEATAQTIVLGLYWDLKGKERTTRIAFPFWWDFDSRASDRRQLSTAFPLFWRWQRDEETTCVLLNAAWTRGTGAQGESWSFHLFPFVDVGSDRPEHFRWQVLGGLLGHERQGERHRWRVGFLWTDPTG